MTKHCKLCGHPKKPTDPEKKARTQVGRWAKAIVKHTKKTAKPATS